MDYIHSLRSLLTSKAAFSAKLYHRYYKEAKQTADVLGEDGWLHTGDVGELQPSGALKIIDRKKQVYKGLPTSRYQSGMLPGSGASARVLPC